MNKRFWLAASAGILCAVAPSTPACAQADGFSAVQARVDFSKTLRPWDGFGFNYVELTQTFDPDTEKQDYGGWGLLCEKDRARLVDMVFGVDGLQPGVVKMFFNPFLQADPKGAFDHTTHTTNMRAFVHAGLDVTRARGGDLKIVTTMYGPPAWATKQKVVRGRDFDPTQKDALTNYMADWVRHLVKVEKLPVSYVSLHNEGEGWERWPRDGVPEAGTGDDYNMYWPPALVVDFIKAMPGALQRKGVGKVGVASGETFSVDRFYRWGYADAIADDPRALRALGLITSHGFLQFGYGRWNGKHTSVGFDILRAKRPNLHAWITSTSWADMDSLFGWQLFSHIYINKVNAVIPWAGIQRPGQWPGGDPNPGAAFHVSEAGELKILPGYFVYKQFSRVGQPGMNVARVHSMDSEISLVAFAGGKSGHPDAFVLINANKEQAKDIHIDVVGSRANTFAVHRSVDNTAPPPGHPKDSKQHVFGLLEAYKAMPQVESQDGVIRYQAPPRSVTTFVALPAGKRARP